MAVHYQGCTYTLVTTLSAAVEAVGLKSNWVGTSKPKCATTLLQVVMTHLPWSSP